MGSKEIFKGEYEEGFISEKRGEGGGTGGWGAQPLDP